MLKMTWNQYADLGHFDDPTVSECSPLALGLVRLYPAPLPVTKDRLHFIDCNGEPDSKARRIFLERDVIPTVQVWTNISI